MFPQLAGVPIDYAWGGHIDISMRRAPDIGRHGQRFWLQGFSGHGVLPTLAGARAVADAVLGDERLLAQYQRIRNPRFPGGDRLAAPLEAIGKRLVPSARYRLTAPEPTMNEQEEIESLAILIRDLRKHRKVTLNDLAERIGRSVGFLSQVERGLSRPTVADLTAIGEALGVPTTYFYSLSKPRSVPWVTRPDERRTVYYAAGITDILVSPNMRSRFSILESHLAPGASSGERPVDDSDEQGGFVLEGELTIWVDGDDTPVTLGPNDAFQLPAHKRFRYANLTDAPTRVIWVFT